MIPRNRIAKILNHENADCVPCDFGAFSTTGIAVSMVYRIKQHFGLLEPGQRIKVIEPYQMLGEIDDQLRDLIGIDTVPIGSQYNMFGYKNENWKEWTMFDGTPVLVPEDFNTDPDENGNIPMYARGDKNYLPSAIMPKGGFYFDSTKRQSPIDEKKLDPRDNTEEFSLLRDEVIQHIKSSVDKLYDETDYAVCLRFPGSGYGDIAAVPGPSLKNPKGIRDVAEWYMSLALRPGYIKEVFSIQSEIALENLKKVYAAVGNKVQVVALSGTDFGTQNCPMISCATYCEIFAPYQKKLNNWVHENTAWKTFMHSCGSIDPLIPNMIEAGFDIINPVQCSAENMDAQMLKDKYGDKVTFWGGGVDTQKTLPFGTAQQVKDEVAQLINTFKSNGGYVFNTIHNLQAGTPIENFVAMLQAYHENRNY